MSTHIEVRQGLLIASAVRYFADSNASMRRDSHKFANIYSYIGADDCVGVRTLRPLAPPQDDWSDWVENVFFFDQLFHEYRLETYIAVLKSDKIQLVAQKQLPASDLDRCDKLFRQYLQSEDEGEIVLAKEYKLRTRRLLYLEPSEYLITSAKTYPDAANGVFQAIAKEMIQYRDGNNHASMPAYIDGIVLLPGIENPPWHEQIAFGVHAMQRTDDMKPYDLCVPETIWNLLRLHQFTQIVSHLADLAMGHPFVAVPVHRYIRNLRSSTSLSSSYDRAFVDDKISGDLLALRIKERLDEIETVIADNRIVQAVRSGDAKYFDFKPEQYTYNVLTKFLKYVDEQKAAAVGGLGFLRSHSQILSDVLRDAVNVEIGTANVLIQRAVVKLTFVGIGVAIFALATTFVPDSAKEYLAAAIVNYFNETRYFLRSL